jgi:hypothetical protein
VKRLEVFSGSFPEAPHSKGSSGSMVRDRGYGVTNPSTAQVGRSTEEELPGAADIGQGRIQLLQIASEALTFPCQSIDSGGSARTTCRASSASRQTYISGMYSGCGPASERSPPGGGLASRGRKRSLPGAASSDREPLQPRPSGKWPEDAKDPPGEEFDPSGNWTPRPARGVPRDLCLATRRGGGRGTEK